MADIVINYILAHKWTNTAVTKGVIRVSRAEAVGDVRVLHLLSVSQYALLSVSQYALLSVSQYALLSVSQYAIPW
jgi:hypothetical protein